MYRRVRPRMRALVSAVLAALVLAFVFPQAPVGMAAEPEGGTTGGTIAGRVVAADGNGLEGVEVTAWRYGVDADPVFESVQTDANGYFEITGLPPGTYEVEAVLEGRLGQAFTDVELNDQEEVKLEFTLDDIIAQGGVSGTVEVDSGWSAEVSFGRLHEDQDPYGYYTRWWIRADDNGQFAIFLPAGRYVMQATAHADDASLSYGREINVPQSEPLQVTIPLSTSRNELAEIQGELHLPENWRARYVDVNPWNDEEGIDWTEWWGASLGAEGATAFHIANLPAGEYLVTIELADDSQGEPFAWYWHHQWVTLGEKESAQVDFEVQPPAIVRGRILDESGNALPYAHVSAFHEATNFQYGYSVTADDGGEFTIYLAAGTHELWVRSPDWSASTLYGTITVEPGEELNLEDVHLIPDQPGPGDDEPPGDDGGQEPGGGDDQQPGDDEQQQPGEEGDQQPGDDEQQDPGEEGEQQPGDNEQEQPGSDSGGNQQPGPGTPPPAPAPTPQPEEPRSGDRVVDREALEDLLKRQPGDAPLVVDAELGKRVAFHAGASDTLKEAGKPAVTLNFGGPSLHVPVANLDLRELVAVNPALQDVLDDEGVEIHYAVQPSKHDRLPTGLVASGDAYDITLSVYSPSAGELPVARLAVPVTITLPVTVELNAGSSMVAVWHVRDDGSATPVPSWMTGENMVSASLTHFSTYVPAVREPAFTDTRGHWAEREIGIAYSHGIVNGKTAAMFDPDVPVTRAEFVAMLARTLGWEPDPAAATRFKDVPAGSWYAGVVGAAAKSGIVKGTTDTTFSPGYRITRLQLAVLIGRALKAQGYKLQATPDEVLARFRDAKDVGAWAREDLALAVQAGIVKGVTPHTLEPGAAATRAQVAVMLVRYLDHVFGPASK